MSKLSEALSPAKRMAIARLVRAAVYGGLAVAASYGAAHVGQFEVPVWLTPTVTAVLLAVDKWAREAVKGAFDEE